MTAISAAVVLPEVWPVLNGWEKDLGAYLASVQPHHIRQPQALTFRLAKKTSYTPDWITWGGVGCQFLTAWECKGFSRQSGRIKIKMAARLFPQVVFIFCTRPKGKKGGWQFERISA